MVNIYAIYDKKADLYGPVFDAKNDVVCQRDLLANIFKNENHPYVAFAEDYALWCLGSMDDNGFIMPAGYSEFALEDSLVGHRQLRFVCEFKDLKEVYNK